MMHHSYVTVARSGMLRKPETFLRGVALAEQQRGMSALVSVDEQLKVHSTDSGISSVRL